MGNTASKKNANTTNTTATPDATSKDVHFGDGVLDAVKTDTNSRFQELTKILIDLVFDYLEKKVKNLPETIKQLRNAPEMEKTVSALWSEQLFEKGLIPKGYCGLPDEFLIHNFHQDGYLDGLYSGYLITVLALADSGVSKDTLLAARGTILDRLVPQRYEERGDLCQQLEGKIRKWSEVSEAEKQLL